MIDFIFLGDSLTFGYGVKPKDNWVHKLSEYLKLNILNKGVNGNTTTDMLFRFYEDVVSNSPKSLFIMGGTNDLLSNRPVSKIIENMEVMIKEAFAKNIKVAGKRTVFVLANENKNVYLSARNLPDAEIVTASSLNTYKIMNNRSLVLCESSVAVINEF